MREFDEIHKDNLFLSAGNKEPLPLFPREGLDLGIARTTRHETSKIHTHDFFEIAIVESGTAIHSYENAAFNVTPGDVFVIYPHHQHQYLHTRNFALANIVFYDNDSIPLLAELTRRPAYHAMFTLEPSLRRNDDAGRRLCLDYKRLRDLVSLIEKYEKSLFSSASFGPAVATVHFLEIINYLCDAYSEIAPSEGQKLTRLSDAVTHVDANFKTAIQVEELAKLSNMSLRSFQRNFRQTFDISPVGYVVRRRIEEACRLLRDSKASITQVAFRSGFKDPTYFSRLFRREIGISPRQYRQGNSMGG